MPAWSSCASLVIQKSDCSQSGWFASRFGPRLNAAATDPSRKCNAQARVWRTSFFFLDAFGVRSAFLVKYRLSTLPSPLPLLHKVFTPIRQTETSLLAEAHDMAPKQALCYIQPSIRHLRDETSGQVIPTLVETARLASELWERDGRQYSPEDYWLEAEYRLRNEELLRPLEATATI